MTAVLLVISGNAEHLLFKVAILASICQGVQSCNIFVRRFSWMLISQIETGSPEYDVMPNLKNWSSLSRTVLQLVLLSSVTLIHVDASTSSTPWPRQYNSTDTCQSSASSERPEAIRYCSKWALHELQLPGRLKSNFSGVESYVRHPTAATRQR